MKSYTVKKLTSIFNTCLELDENGNEPSQLEIDIAGLLADVLIGEGYCPHCGAYNTKTSDVYICNECKNTFEI